MSQIPLERGKVLWSCDPNCTVFTIVDFKKYVSFLDIRSRAVLIVTIVAIILLYLFLL